MPYNSYYLDSSNDLHRALEHDQIKSTLKGSTGVLWIDIDSPEQSDQSLLLDEFDFHPLLVDTSLDVEPSAARVEDFGRYVFVNARSIDYTLESDVLQTTNLSMFIGSNYVVTIHNVAMPSVEAIRGLVEIDGRPLAKGPAFLAHAHFDALIQAILPTLERMSDRADAIEEQILTSPDDSALATLMALKRSSLGLNRALLPQRDVLNRLGRREFELIGSGVDLYFRDLFDDLLRVQAANDAIRERADTALATYLSAVSNRQNEIMKILSIVATIFMPLGLIAGIFGMNIQNMPGTEFQWGYHIVWVLALVGFVITLWMLWLKRWLVGGQTFLRRQRLGRFVPTAVDPVRLTGYVGRAATRNLRRMTDLPSARPIRRPPVPRYDPAPLKLAGAVLGRLRPRRRRPHQDTHPRSARRPQGQA
ncbi:MAG: magnesium/cobalt transporter CorA [Chloroflexi bacterium]|nr:magnesium/cobalt transporter CorA [Chloroflexota bacterium]